MLGPSRTPVFRKHRDPVERRRGEGVSPGQAPPARGGTPPPRRPSPCSAHRTASISATAATAAPTLEISQSYPAPADRPIRTGQGGANRRCAVTSLSPAPSSAQVLLFGRRAGKGRSAAIGGRAPREGGARAWSRDGGAWPRRRRRRRRVLSPRGLEAVGDLHKSLLRGRSAPPPDGARPSDRRVVPRST